MAAPRDRLVPQPPARARPQHRTRSHRRRQITSDSPSPLRRGPGREYRPYPRRHFRLGGGVVAVDAVSSKWTQLFKDEVNKSVVYRQAAKGWKWRVGLVV